MSNTVLELVSKTLLIASIGLYILVSIWAFRRLLKSSRMNRRRQQSLEDSYKQVPSEENEHKCS